MSAWPIWADFILFSFFLSPSITAYFTFILSTYFFYFYFSEAMVFVKKFKNLLSSSKPLTELKPLTSNKPTSIACSLPQHAVSSAASTFFASSQVNSHTQKQQCMGKYTIQSQHHSHITTFMCRHEAYSKYILNSQFMRTPILHQISAKLLRMCDAIALRNDLLFNTSSLNLHNLKQSNTACLLTNSTCSIVAVCRSTRNQSHVYK